MASHEAPTRNRRALRDEEPWLPTSIEDLADVIGRLDGTYTHGEIFAPTDWLVRKAKGWPDPTSSATRARYRKLLRELADDLEPVRI